MQLQAELRHPETYVVPNEFTLPKVDPDLQAPEDLTDYGNHGTTMAAAAAGTRYGIASDATLYLIKFKNAQRVGGKWVENETPEAVDDAFSHIFDIVRTRGLQGRAVVSFSQCK